MTHTFPDGALQELKFGKPQNTHPLFWALFGPILQSLISQLIFREPVKFYLADFLKWPVPKQLDPYDNITTPRSVRVYWVRKGEILNTGPI